MHELSIANQVIEIVSSHARDEDAETVLAVTLRIGSLTCVHKDALEFSFELASQGTIAEGARLELIDVPVSIYCEVCQAVVQLPGIQSFRCPACGTASNDIRSGNELEVETIEVENVRVRGQKLESTES